MPSRKKILIISASLIASLLLFIALMLPLIVRSKAVEALQEATGRPVAIESVSINPFTLTIAINKFYIHENSPRPFISIDRISASLGLASIFKRALIISSLEISKPAITFTRTAPNQYSFSDILEKQNKGPKKEHNGQTQFSINNISIDNGSVDFNDMAVKGGRKHTVRKLELKIPFISNIPYLIDKYTDPKLSAEINGASFNFNGKLKPLHKSLETSVHVDLKQLNLPELVAYSPQKPPAELKSGKLTIDTEVSYRISAEKKPELNIKGLIRLNDLGINMPDGQPLATLPELSVQAGQLEVFARIFQFDSILFDRLELFLQRDSKGRWSHDRLKQETKPSVNAAPDRNSQTKKEDAPRITVNQFQLLDSRINLRDALPKGGFKGALDKINLKLSSFSNQKDKTAVYQLSMLIDDADFKTEGQFSITPLSATTKLSLNGLKLQRGWPYLAQFLTAPVNGTLDLSSDINYSAESGLSTQNGNLAIKNLSTRFNRKEGFELALFGISGAAFSQKENSLSVGSVQLSSGKLTFSREKDGRFSPLSLLVSKPAQTTAGNASQQTQPKQPAKDQPALSYSVKQFQLDRFNIAFTDNSREGEPDFSLRNTSLSLANFSGPRFKPAQLRFTATLNKNASLRASGQMTPQPFHYRGDLSISQLQISDFEDYFPENLNVDIINGSFDTKLKLDVTLKDGKPSGIFKGSSGIRGFHSIDSISEEDLLKWESLQFDNFDGHLEPLTVNISQIAMNNFYSRIIVRKDGTLNLQNLVDKSGPGTGDQGPGTATQPPEKSAPKAGVSAPQSPATSPGHSTATQIKIGAVTLQGGTLNFTDNHLPQHFTTTFFNLGGRVSGLSSEDLQMADVDLRGNLENHSPLQITGKINPLREDLFVDLKVSFKDIDLSPVTPYSGTFLGYTVEKGKLFLDLKYHIEKKELNSDNRIFIDQFTFGNKVESDKATSLPVKLGLALLKDRKGEIHLDVPVTGRTDDPKFSIWKLVFQVLKNLLVKAVTSPFSLLSSMFGGGEDLSTIQFAYGSSTLKPQDELKLKALSKALEDRPALKLELKAYVDRDRDAESYKSELLERKIRNEKYLALSKAQQGTTSGADTVKVLPEEYSGYLKAVYKKEKFPKPRNMIGMVKDLPDNEMKKLIITNTIIGNNELRALAQERSSSVLNYLVKEGKVDSKRIFQKMDDIMKKPEKEGLTGSRVELNAIVQ